MKTRTPSPSSATARHGTTRSLIRGVFLAVAAAMITTSAQGAFHLWNINEIYTDSSGSLQFIELFDSSGFQNSVNGMQISVSNVGATQTHNFILPGGSLSGNTFNHALLFGTAGLQAAGGPAPDYIIPDNFLFSAGGSISFFGANSGPYTAMPTDGVNSRTWGNGNAVNSPQNYAGQTGLVVVPEPSVLALLALASVGFGLQRRRLSI